MRKADYAELAQIIRELLAFSEVNGKAADATQQGRAYHNARIAALKTLAHQCSERLSVDKAAFLRACGISSDSPGNAPSR